MKEKYLNSINAVINFFAIALAVLLPVFYLPITTEFFEFNKLTLFAVSTGVLTLLWSAKIVMTQRIGIRRTKLDLPMLLLLIVFVLSSIFSLDKTSSIFGSYGRWFPSLYGITAFFLFYYVITSNLQGEKMVKFILGGFMASSTVSTAVAILSYYGIYLSGGDYLKFRTFNLSGSATTVIELAAMVVMMAIVWLLSTKNLFAKLALQAAVLINLFFILLTGTVLGWAMLGTGVLLTLILVGAKKFKENKTKLVLLFGVIAALVLITLSPVTRKVVTNGPLGMEIKLDPTSSWQISLTAMRDFPVLGTGPSTFSLNFPRYRPVNLNNGIYWNVRFDKPYNELFDVIGSLGILGIVVALFFAYRVFSFVFSKDEIEPSKHDLLNILIVGATMSFVVLGLTYATVLNTFTIVLTLSLIVMLKAEKTDTNISERSEPFSLTIAGSNRDLYHLTIVAPLVVLAFVGLFFTYRTYSSEYYMRKAVEFASVNNGNKTYEYQSKAINANPRRDYYQSSFAQTNLLLAVNMSSQKDISDQQKETIQQLVSQAIRSTRLVTEVINPLNINGWETRASIYRSIIGIAQDADQWAISAYNTAVQLDPTNPGLRLDLGGVYFANKDYLTAANLYKQATNLKTDYANAYYNLAQALIMLKDYDNAKRALETTKNLVPVDSPDAAKIQEDIDSIKDLVTTNTKPTVNEISTKGSTPNTISQEPITNVANEATTSNNQ